LADNNELNKLLHKHPRPALHDAPLFSFLKGASLGFAVALITSIIVTAILLILLYAHIIIMPLAALLLTIAIYVCAPLIPTLSITGGILMNQSEKEMQKDYWEIEKRAVKNLKKSVDEVEKNVN
jgi:hypothetical protein